MATAKILIVDDDLDMLQQLRRTLTEAGHTVHVTDDATAALTAVRTFQPDLVILDITLSAGRGEMSDGIELLRRIRAQSEVYVLMLSGTAASLVKAFTLTIGADDYLTKPFSQDELLARIQAILRRRRDGVTGNTVLAFSRLRIDLDSRQVWKDDAIIDLTPIEFNLLRALVQHRGQAITRAQLIERVWGHDYFGDPRVVDVHLGRLRKKVEDDLANPTLIATVRGVGYRFQDGPLEHR